MSRLPPPSLPRRRRPEASASGSETAMRRRRSKLTAPSPSDRLPSLPRAPADGVEIDGKKGVSGRFRSDLTHTADGQPVAVRSEDVAEEPRHRRGRPWRRRLSPLLTPPLFFFEADTTQERPQPRRHHPCSPSWVVPEACSGGSAAETEVSGWQRLGFRDAARVTQGTTRGPSCFTK
jgi:hypothetical protein